jgi:MFS family permease
MTQKPAAGHSAAPHDSPEAIANALAAAHQSPREPAGELPDDGRSRLYLDRSFWAFTATQFLGAFNDNLFKQMVLLLAVPAVAATAVANAAVIASESVGAATADDLQAVAMFVFSVPFLLFSGFAGFLSDRFSKTWIIVLAKVGEIAIMLLGMAAFVAMDTVGLTGLMAVMFLMGSQSAFFGPSKYGILPELFRERDLPRANGVVQMTTFLAIILGTATAGFLLDQFTGRLWLSSSVCVGLAVTGTATALMIRRLPASSPQLPLRLESLAIPRDIRRLLAANRPLLAALLASCMFWLVAGRVLPSVNALGKNQLGLSDTTTSLLAASISLGIAAGCMTAGLLSRGGIRPWITVSGAWGIVITMGLMAITLPGGQHLLGPTGSVPALIAGGFFAGMFAVPIAVYLQSKPPQGLKGRMIATMNIANWFAIVLSSILYGAFNLLFSSLEWPPSLMFAVTALLMVPVAMFYRPVSERLH